MPGKLGCQSATVIAQVLRVGETLLGSTLELNPVVQIDLLIRRQGIQG